MLSLFTHATAQLGFAVRAGPTRNSPIGIGEAEAFLGLVAGTVARAKWRMRYGTKSNW
jgi:hypothetical protein